MQYIYIYMFKQKLKHNDIKISDTLRLWLAL